MMEYVCVYIMCECICWRVYINDTTVAIGHVKLQDYNFRLVLVYAYELNACRCVCYAFMSDENLYTFVELHKSLN